MNIEEANDDDKKKNCRLAEDLTASGSNIDPEIDLGPIVGYAREPLLPLTKACSPLNSTCMIYNLWFYVQLAIDGTPEQPANDLTIDESAAIRLYTIEWPRPHRSLYSMLNQTLKSANRDDLRPYFKYLKLFLTALAKLRCIPPQTVWRGVTKDFSANFLPGTLVTWWAFSSCTTTMTVLNNNMYLGDRGSRTLFSIETINGRTIRAHSHYEGEDEILLLPGTNMIVQSQLNPAPDLHIIHLKQVIPKVTLLELPFKGTLNIFKYFAIQVFHSLLRCKSLSQASVSLLSTMFNCPFDNFFLKTLNKTSLVSEKRFTIPICFMSTMFIAAIVLVYFFVFKSQPGIVFFLCIASFIIASFSIELYIIVLIYVFILRKFICLVNDDFDIRTRLRSSLTKIQTSDQPSY